LFVSLRFYVLKKKKANDISVSRAWYIYLHRYMKSHIYKVTMI